METSWDAVRSIVCYWIWTRRNRRVHDQQALRPWKPWDFVIEQARCYVQINVAQRMVQKRHTEVVNTSWYPLNMGG
jgi:hypothetical protein